MSRRLSQNTLLALTDQGRMNYKNLIADYCKYFSKDQGYFRGERKTHTAFDGYQPDPSKIGFSKLVTTVDSKLRYFINTAQDFFANLFSQERTNALSGRTVKLEFGKHSLDLTATELLRLKSLLEKAELGNLTEMISKIPTRNVKQRWNLTNDQEFSGVSQDDTFGIWESELLEEPTWTTIKRYEIISDPDAAVFAAKGVARPPIQVQIDKREQTGKSTFQEFSGEITHHERVAMINRLNDLSVKVNIALKEANDVESIASPVTADIIFGYIFYGE